MERQRGVDTHHLTGQCHSCLRQHDDHRMCFQGVPPVVAQRPFPGLRTPLEPLVASRCCGHCGHCGGVVRLGHSGGLLVRVAQSGSRASILSAVGRHGHAWCHPLLQVQESRHPIPEVVDPYYRLGGLFESSLRCLRLPRWSNQSYRLLDLDKQNTPSGLVSPSTSARASRPRDPKAILVGASKGVSSLGGGSRGFLDFFFMKRGILGEASVSHVVGHNLNSLINPNVPPRHVTGSWQSSGSDVTSGWWYRIPESPEAISILWLELDVFQILKKLAGNLSPPSLQPRALQSPPRLKVGGRYAETAAVWQKAMGDVRSFREREIEQVGNP